MLGISVNKESYFLNSCLAILIFSSINLKANASTNDLLLNEQWGLENISVQTSTQSNSPDPTVPESRGTCASTPQIEGDSYSCETFTAPAVNDIDLNSQQAWDLIPTTEQEVIIGLIDTGIDYLHPDLRSKVWLNSGEALFIDGNNNGIDDGCEDLIDLDNNGYLDDCHGINTQVPRELNGSLNPTAGDPIDGAVGHGTNMAGVLGAIGNNAGPSFHGGVVGVTGVHNNIRIATCAAADLHFDAYTTIPGLGGAYGTREDILECFDYFLSLKARGENIVVINGSGGASQFNNLFNIFFPKGEIREKFLLNTPEVSTAIQQLADHDINLVVAAGNNAWDIEASHENAYYPAAFTHDNIIAVGAINNQGNIWKSSSYGRWSVDVFAPGERILSTNPRVEITGAAESADYIVSDGTSQATAFVSGMIALARTYPQTATLSASDLRRLLISSGKTLPQLAHKSVSGKLARLVDSNDNGMLNCNNQLFQRRHWPQASTIQKLPGDWLQLEVASYDCHAPSQHAFLTATIAPTGESVQLFDNGIYPDKQAHDGIYSAQWQVQGDHEIYTVTWGEDSVTNAIETLTVTTAIIVDNTDRNTKRVGGWWPSIYRSGFYGANYQYAYGSKNRSFTWKPTVPKAGYYEVLANWPKHDRYTRHAEYTIEHGLQSNPNSRLVIANQSKNGGEWNSLGKFWFDEGEYNIQLTNKNITSIVIADAIKLRLVQP